MRWIDRDRRCSSYASVMIGLLLVYQPPVLLGRALNDKVGKVHKVDKVSGLVCLCATRLDKVGKVILGPTKEGSYGSNLLSRIDP
jgi:hypothetical protein